MKVVAFLQNCWFKPGTPKVIVGQYLTDQEYRRKVLGNTMTGRRLKRAFGEHYNQIWWDNASTDVGSYAAAKLPAYLPHMWRVVKEQKPDVILAFGKTAQYALMYMQGESVTSDGIIFPKFHVSKHPVAFGVTQVQLNEFAAQIISRYF